MGDLADIGAFGAERSGAGDGVTGRSTRGHFAVGHGFAEADRAVLIDQGHGALVQVVALQEGFVSGGQDIDDGVANGGDIVSKVGGGGHDTIGSLSVRNLIAQAYPNGE